MSSATQERVFRGDISVHELSYHGWPECFLISNGVAEVIVVPSIGRVMQFRMAGDVTGVFWENRSLDGEFAAAPELEWTNFGGDKTWPAPQDDWGNVTGRIWPPPLAFDSMPLKAEVKERELVLTSPVDPSYGIQTVRHVVLDKTSAKLAIRTIYNKISGSAVNVGVWIVTQLRDPEMVFALLPEQPKRAPGFYQMVGEAAYGFVQQGRIIGLRRDPANNLKTGAEGNSLAWVGQDYVVRIDHDSSAGATSIYTNMDPLQYIELETEGPVAEMNIGDRIELTNTYELSRRTTKDVMAEAQRVFGLQNE